MVRTSELHSATAQFFINVKDNAFSTTRRRTFVSYAVSARSPSGMDVVDKIVNGSTGPKGPFTADALQENITIKA